MEVHASHMSWIVDYLTGKSQHVRFQHCVSHKVISNIGRPQGTVLSPLLFSLYTEDYSRWTEPFNLQKFSDDSTVVGCIGDGDETEYWTVVYCFVTWCEQNHLQRDKDQGIYCGHSEDQETCHPVSIQVVDLDIVEDYNYLRVHTDNNLDWI